MQNTGEDYFGLISINVEGKYYKFMGWTGIVQLFGKMFRLTFTFIKLISTSNNMVLRVIWD